eukprot:gene6225-9561_t
MAYRENFWPVQVLVIDSMLVLDCRKSISVAVVVLTCAWLVVRQAEVTFVF